MTSFSNKHQCFPVGSLVEVHTEEKGPYLVASVISSHKRLVHVEYQSLFTEGGGSERVQDYVEASCVRPAPPQEETNGGFNFKPDDMVDAFYKEGWWAGVVSQVVEGGERVVVKFHSRMGELEFGLSDLRAHWDWEKGVWVKEESGRFMAKMFAVGNVVEILLNRGSYREALIHRALGSGVLRVEYEVSNEDVEAQVNIWNVRPCPPLLVDDERKLLMWRRVDAYYDSAWWSGEIVRKVENGRFVVFLDEAGEEKEFDKWSLRPHMDWKYGKWLLLSSFRDDGDVDDHNQNMPLSRKRQHQSDSGTCLERNKKDNAVEQENQSIVPFEPQTSLPCQGYVLPSPEQMLPFMKSADMASIWKKIESRRVFQMMPQTPHFKPLERVSEFLREGSAIGHMVCFAHLVERACLLQLNDPKNVIDEIIEGLETLKTYGFDVSSVRDRMTELLTLKAEQEKFVCSQKSLSNCLDEHSLEKSRIEEEILDMNEQMGKLQEKISLAQSAKEKEDSEIASLQAGLEETEEKIMILERAFEGITSCIMPGKKI